jgi:hypothetical protein
LKVFIKGMKSLVHNNQWPFTATSHGVSILSGARYVNLNGGELYAVGGNLTIQRAGECTISGIVQMTT